VVGFSPIPYFPTTMYKTAEANLKEQRERRQVLRNNLTPAEAALWKMLKERQVQGLKFRRQHGLGPYIMDFYCPAICLCIELDGEVHKSSGAFAYDEARSRFLAENGIKVMRFDNEVVWKFPSAIINEICEYYEAWKKR